MLQTGRLGGSCLGPSKKMKTFAKIIAIPALLLASLLSGHASDERFSMQIQGKPLAVVFQDLAQLSGSAIVFDKAWEDFPVNVRFVNLSLEKAITKILTNLNHVVIFEQDNIRIQIYGPVSPDKNMDRMSTASPYSKITPADNGLGSSAPPPPVGSRQGNDTDEAVMEAAQSEAEAAQTEAFEQEAEAEETKREQEAEAEETEASEQETEAEETEELDQKDVEKTNEKEEAEEQERIDDVEADPPDNEPEAEDSAASN